MGKMKMEFTIRGIDNRDKVSVAFSFPANQDIKCCKDESILLLVSIVSGCFRVDEYSMYGRVMNLLVQFTEDLERCYSTLEGTASFYSDEWDDDGLRFSLTMLPKGHALVSGELVGDCSLTFRFETDQSFLQETLTELKAILKTFNI